MAAGEEELGVNSSLTSFDLSDVATNQVDLSDVAAGEEELGVNKSAHEVEENLGVSVSSPQSQYIDDFKREGALSSAQELGSNISKSLASALRTGNISDFMSELTATVSQVRRNSASGQDITFQLRSDVLEGTSIHIHANKTQMQVDFSTTSAASNALLSEHLTTLQNHLTTLCPGQVVEVKNQYLTSSYSAEWKSDQGGEDDSAGSHQEGKRNSNHHDETL